ncbi:MAG TPA: hypothetical protein VFJ29_01055 [Candidatus Kapabacteria bacterium]|nr:hypothetical protein [Candidatus Kapabacteria bacterium]
MSAVSQQLSSDFTRFAERGMPERLEEYVLETYALDLSSRYGNIPVKNPFGKASGQLSLALHQVEKDAQAGLGFCVLKTVIAQDAAGAQSMKAWAIPETHMLVEKIKGTRADANGEEGWTVTWKGRGWYDTFDNYMKFFGKAIAAGKERGMLVVPSCKYHLPSPEEETWKESEYEYTTQRLLGVWERAGSAGPMPIEKDFSPTLAGSDLSRRKKKILEWILHAPALIRKAAAGKPIHIGVKVFNAMFEDEFQIEMLRALACGVSRESAADFLIYANRLFDPEKVFEDHKGVAYGGPDLSARNLAMLKRFSTVAKAEHLSLPPICATGNIDSGARAIEHLRMGCASFQMHTFFQLPDECYAMKTGSKTQRALHTLLFHPEHGFIAGMFALREELDLPKEWSVGRVAEELKLKFRY